VPTPPNRIFRTLAAGLLATAVLAGGGCFVANLAGAIGNEIERNKKIEVLAEYEGLENRTVAVVVHADAATLYEFPSVAQTVASNVAFRLQTNVRGISILPPASVATWQYQTPAWSTLPYGQIADELNVDRVVLIDLYEYRLNPPGNMYLWEGVAAANVGVIERNGLDPDSFAMTFDVRERFPKKEGIGRESATAGDIQTGLLTKFVQRCAYLFYDHIEDKYPDAK